MFNGIGTDWRRMYLDVSSIEGPNSILYSRHDIDQTLVNAMRPNLTSIVLISCFPGHASTSVDRP